MSESNLAVGDIVLHPRRPGWGPGKVVRVDPDAVHAIWRDRPEAVAAKIMTSAVTLERYQGGSDPILDNLPPLVEKDGKLTLGKERITFQQAVDRFLAVFPGGFYDPAYLGKTKNTGERNYKALRAVFFRVGRRLTCAAG